MPICDYCHTLGAMYDVFERADYEWRNACGECYKRIMYD